MHCSCASSAPVGILMRGCGSSCRARSCSTWPASVGAPSCSTAGCCRRSRQHWFAGILRHLRSRHGGRGRALVVGAHGGSHRGARVARSPRRRVLGNRAGVLRDRPRSRLDLPRGIIEVTGPRAYTRKRPALARRGVRAHTCRVRAAGPLVLSGNSSGGVPWSTSVSCRTASTSGTTPSSSRAREWAGFPLYNGSLRDAPHDHDGVECDLRDGELLPGRASRSCA